MKTQDNHWTSRFAEQLEAVLLNACGFFFAVMTLVALLGVLFRYVIGDALSWTEELTRFCMIFVGLFGAAVALFRDEHVGFSVVLDAMPPRVARMAIAASHALIMLFAGVMTVYGYKLAVMSGTWAQILPIPMIVPLMIVPASGLSIVLFLAVKLWKLNRRSQ